jgi:hypothetical protein
MISNNERFYNVTTARVLLRYVLCPTTGRTLDTVRDDDKVICDCDEARQSGGTHLVSQCLPSTVEQWCAERGYTPYEGGR